MKDVFTELLLVDVVRGHHSTGAAVVKRFNDEILMEKGPIPSPMFIGTKQYRDLIDTFGIKVMIGHNRYATVGEKTALNAHPFQFDNLVGAHNGTLDNWALKRLDNWAAFGTDSEALYNSVSTRGIKETIGSLTGAWALTWFDKQDNTINLLRNAKRPLFYAYSEDRATIFWGSEAHMLEWILIRNHVKLFEQKVFACDVDKHYRWEIPEKLGDKFEKPVLAEIKERTSHQNVRDFSWQHDSDWYERRNDYSQSTLPISNPPPKKAPEKIDPKKFRPPYKNYLGQIINKTKFEELVSGGCVFCDQATSVWGDFIHPLKNDVDGRNLYLCRGCYEDDDVRELIENSL